MGFAKKSIEASLSEPIDHRECGTDEVVPAVWLRIS